MKWPDYSEEKLLNLIRREIVEQSDRFNKTRSFDPNSYGSRDLSLVSYGNFFFPVLGKQWLLPCPRLTFSETGKLPAKDHAILDLGSGSGASGLASLFLLRKWGLTNSMALEAWDYSGKSLAMMKTFIGLAWGFGPTVKFLPRGRI